MTFMTPDKICSELVPYLLSNIITHLNRNNK